MTTEEQREAIARACNWKWDEITIWKPGGAQFHRYHPMVPTRDQLYDLIQDYPNDLNAMHEAEKSFNEDQFYQYYRHLIQVVGGPNDLHPICATAAQRAEAFLLTLGLWKD